MQIISDSSEPTGAASPIGPRCSGYHLDARYAPGILIATTDIILCTNEPTEKLYAQKKPLKQK